MITGYTNGRVYTFDSRDSVVEAFAMQDHRFIAVGTNDEILAMAGRKIDLQGATVVPGFIDAHVHLIDYGLMLQMTVDLVGCVSLAEMLDRLKRHARESGAEWLFGHGFDQELFGTGTFPTREDLDTVVKDRPLIVSRICGHAVIGNSPAVELSQGLTEESRRSGMVTEDDIAKLTYLAPEPSDADIDQAILTAGGMAANLGITGVHCLLNDMRQFDRLKALNDDGLLPIRFTAQLPFSQLDEVVRRGLRTGDGDDWLRIGAMKVFADGSLGARTAAMIDEYSDDPGNHGLLLLDHPELTEMIRKAESHGFQCAIHAIGDKAVEVVVNSIEAAIGREGNKLRHRIEHASQMTATAVQKMSELGIAAAIQPQFVLTDFWTIQRVGPERYALSYPLKSMLSAGIHCAMSSDCWVERLDPYELIYRAWVRDAASQNECLSPVETIRAYTAGSAYAGHAEKSQGSIESGKLADFIIFDKPLFDLSPDEILKVRPRQVVISGTG